MSRTERARPDAATRIRWQFDADVPTSDILDEIDLATDGGLYEALEYFTDVVRLMKEQLGLESTNERLARHLFGDSWQPDASAATDTNRGEGGGATRVETRSPLRLPAESVKQAILHPDLDTREMAVRYFSDSYTTDLSIMPLVIQSLEKYRKDEAYMLVGAAVRLPQTDATIDWLIGELNQDRSKSYENYTFNLQRVLCAADPRLLHPREREIASAAYLEPGAYEIIAERIGMLAWDADRCWRELEEHCDNHQCCDARDAELGRAGAIVEALARHPVSQERVLDYLAQRVDPQVDSPMKWLEPMMVRLAGLWRLELAIPLLVEKSRSEDDLLHAECEAALIRMSSDAAVRAVADVFAEAERGSRLLAARVLENTHTDLAVQSMLQLIPHEADETISRYLRRSLLAQFSFAAMEPARQWLLEHGFRDIEDRALRNDLLRICEVLGQSLPEFEQWSGDREAEQRERLRMLEESKDNPMGAVLYALEQMTGKKSGEVLKEIEEREASRGEETLIPRPAHSPPRRIGRNDPCPCGSGKKYKKCCLRK